jgi:predicted dehydrogenase
MIYMRVALVGNDEQLLRFAELAASGGEFLPVYAAECPDLVARLKIPHPGIKVIDWQSLLDPQTQANVELICFSTLPDRTQQEATLKKLALLNKPIIVLHPVHDSLIAAYELELFYREKQAFLAPWLPLRTHPFLDQIREWLRAGAASPIGQIENITLERVLVKRDRRTVIDHFARDCDLLRSLIGEISQVMTMAGTVLASSNPYSNETKGNPYSNLSIQLSSEQGITTRWTVASQATTSSATLILTGSNGKILWQLPSPTTAGSAVIQHDRHETALTLPDWSEREIAAQTVTLAQQRQSLVPWNDAARTIEIMDAVERSLARSRKIDVRVEESDDLGNFKGIMASVGCGFLLFSLLLLIICAVAGKVLRAAGWPDMANAVETAWPWFFIVVSGLFLGVQIVIKLAVKPEKK